MSKSSLILVLIVCSISGWSQGTSGMTHEGSSGDIFIGYSLLNGDTLHHGSGWTAALTGNLRDNLGLEADFSGNYKSSGGITARGYNVLFGPQLMSRTKNVNVFVHGLVGIAHFSADGGPSDTGAAWAIGGGLDYDWNTKFGFRPFQLDYHGAHIFSNTQSDLRYSAGLVYRF